MTDILLQHNVASVVTVRAGSSSNSSTAAGTGDNTTKTGITLDRQALQLPHSAIATVLCDATLASGNTLTVAFTIEDSADNSTFGTYQTTAATTVLTGVSGGAAQSSQISLAVDLGSAKRYVRAKFIPDLSAAGTDTAITRAVWVLAGQDRLVAPV